ncbi:MAG: hypothetical protein MUE42_09080 [Opitutaceae bacterium]|jgi:hypothetical protein|nr:hypothetical protein [Opitutaceae bacterium]
MPTPDTLPLRWFIFRPTEGGSPLGSFSRTEPPTPAEATAYALLKSTAGLTPDEILNKETAEGVKLEPALLDFRRVPVFESLAQLEKEWNRGSPAEGGLFMSLGDAIDPADTMTPAEFYHAQRDLLSAARFAPEFTGRP